MTGRIQALAARIRAAERVAVLTGAGISAESGVPTFRDPDGIWARFRPEELASMQAFLANPERVQEWYAHRRTLVSRVTPNAGHRALARLAAMVPRFTLVTQNVDNLHQEAGSPEVIELHGNLTRNYCLSCGTHVETDVPASCASCGGLIRPDVVWFGEMLPDGVFERAHAAASAADVFLSIGTSAVVYPAADLPLAAGRSGAWVVEINIEPSAIAGAMDDVLQGPAGEILPRLVEAINSVGTEA